MEAHAHTCSDGIRPSGGIGGTCPGTAAAAPPMTTEETPSAAQATQETAVGTTPPLLLGVGAANAAAGCSVVAPGMAAVHWASTDGSCGAIAPTSSIR